MCTISKFFGGIALIFSPQLIHCSRTFSTSPSGAHYSYVCGESRTEAHYVCAIKERAEAMKWNLALFKNRPVANLYWLHVSPGYIQTSRDSLAARLEKKDQESESEKCHFQKVFGERETSIFPKLNHNELWSLLWHQSQNRNDYYERFTFKGIAFSHKKYDVYHATADERGIFFLFVFLKLFMKKKKWICLKVKLKYTR